MFREILFWDTGTLGCSLSIASVVVVVVVRFVYKSSFKSSGVVCTVLRSRLRCETRSLGKQSRDVWGDVVCLALQRLAREVGGGRYDSGCQGCAWFALGRRGARGFCRSTSQLRSITVPFPPAKPREDVTILAIRYDPQQIFMCYTCK